MQNSTYIFSAIPHLIGVRIPHFIEALNDHGRWHYVRNLASLIFSERGRKRSFGALFRVTVLLLFQLFYVNIHIRGEAGVV